MRREEAVLGAEPQRSPVPGADDAARARYRRRDDEPGRRRGGARREGLRRRSGRRLPAHARRDARRPRRAREAGHRRPGRGGGMLDLFAQLGVEARLYVAPASSCRCEASPAGAERRRAACRRPGRRSTRSTAGRARGSPWPIDGWDGPLVDIDHHHDNTRFGDLICVRAAGEQHQRDRLRHRRALGLTPSLAAADGALRRHLVRLRPLPPRQHQRRTRSACAAWLAELGVDVTARLPASCTRRRSLGAAAPVGARRRRSACGRRRPGARRRRSRATTTRPPAPAKTRPRASSRPCAPSTASRSAALVKEQSAGARVRVSLRSQRPRRERRGRRCGRRRPPRWRPGSPATTLPRR